MKIFVTVKPNAKVRGVEKIDETHFKISVQESAQEGKANNAVSRAIAEYFGIAPSRVKLLSGRRAKQKFFDLA